MITHQVFSLRSGISSSRRLRKSFVAIMLCVLVSPSFRLNVRVRHPTGGTRTRWTGAPLYRDVSQSRLQRELHVMPCAVNADVRMVFMGLGNSGWNKTL